MQKKLPVLLVVTGIVIAGTVLVLQFREVFVKDDGTSLEARLAEQSTSTPVPVVQAPSARNAETVRSARRADPTDAVRTNTVAVARQEVAPKTNAATNAVKVATKVRPVRTENVPQVPKSRQVLLSHRRIVVAEGRKFPSAFCTTQTMTARKTAPYVLLTERRIDRDVHAQAMADGAKVSGFLPNNALLVEADADALRNLAEDPVFIAAVEYEPMDKLQAKLLAGKDETIKTKVVLMNASYLDAVEAYVTSKDGRILQSAKNGKSFTAVLTRKNITDLAAKGEVRWIEKAD